VNDIVITPPCIVCFHYHLHFRRCLQRLQAQQKNFAPVKKQTFR